MTPDDLLRHLESLLFVSPEPAEISHLAAALEVTTAELEAASEELSERCKWRGIRVQRKGNRLQLASSPDAASYVEKYLGLNAVTRLSQAALETLAIIAYRQPITRPEIEVLRGVDCDGVLRTLTARQLIIEVGRLDTVGHPIRYGTTFEFLRYFGLERLDQLPSLSLAEPAPGAAIQPGAGSAHDSGMTETGPEELSTDEYQDTPAYESPAYEAFEGTEQTEPHAGDASGPAIAPGTIGQSENDPDQEATQPAAAGAPLASGLSTDGGHAGGTAHGGEPGPTTIRAARIERSELGDAAGHAEATAHANEPEPAASGGRSEGIEPAVVLGHAGGEPSNSAADRSKPEPATDGAELEPAADRSKLEPTVADGGAKLEPPGSIPR